MADTFWSAKYKKLRVTLGNKKAIIAIAHKILIAIYWIIRKKQPYKELGKDFVDPHMKERKLNYHKKQLQMLGYEVEISDQIINDSASAA